jgi:hypothetical protein
MDDNTLLKVLEQLLHNIKANLKRDGDNGFARAETSGKSSFVLLLQQKLGCKNED